MSYVPPPDPAVMRRAQNQAQSSWRSNGLNTAARLGVLLGFLGLSFIVSRMD